MAELDIALIVIVCVAFAIIVIASSVLVYYYQHPDEYGQSYFYKLVVVRPRVVVISAARGKTRVDHVVCSRVCVCAARSLGVWGDQYVARMRCMCVCVCVCACAWLRWWG